MVVFGPKDLWPMQLHAAPPLCSCWDVINSIKGWGNVLNTLSLFSSGACHLGRATNSQRSWQRLARSQPPFQLQRVCTCYRARLFVVWTRQKRVQQQAVCPLDDFLFLWECTWRVLLECGRSIQAFSLLPTCLAWLHRRPLTGFLRHVQWDELDRLNVKRWRRHDSDRLI